MRCHTNTAVAFCSVVCGTFGVRIVSPWLSPYCITPPLHFDKASLRHAPKEEEAGGRGEEEDEEEEAVVLLEDQSGQGKQSPVRGVAVRLPCTERVSVCRYLSSTPLHTQTVNESQ